MRIMEPAKNQLGASLEDVISDFNQNIPAILVGKKKKMLRTNASPCNPFNSAQILPLSCTNPALLFWIIRNEFHWSPVNSLRHKLSIVDILQRLPQLAWLKKPFIFFALRFFGPPKLTSTNRAQRAHHQI